MRKISRFFLTSTPCLPTLLKGLEAGITMGDQGGDHQKAGDSNKDSGHDNHKSFDWHHVWKSVEDAGSKATTAIKKQAEHIDTKELGDKAKHAAVDGLNLARGKSSNKQANEISDAAAKYIPGAGLLRTGADLAHETGAEGKLLQGKKGPLHAPSEKTMKNVGKEAIGTVLVIPGGGILSNEVLNRTGVKDKAVDAIVDAANKHKPADKHKATDAPEQKKK
jgi:hypothetical protein